MFPKSLENLSHATIVTGNISENLDLVKKFLGEQGVAISGNPDVCIFQGEQIFMDTAQEIVASVSLKKISEYRFVIIACERMATDVQNRLLKTLEEPSDGTYFFVLVPNTERILPTVLSRCQVIEGVRGAGETRLDVSEFLKANPSQRFALVEAWTKNKKDEDNLVKSEVVHFLDGIEKKLWEHKNRDEQLFNDIRKMREYAKIRGASHRVILDFIAMISPEIKK